MGIFNKFNKETKDKNIDRVSSMKELTIELNARLQPILRGEMFEDPLDDKLRRDGIGEVLGGGTFQLATGEIKKCDISVSIREDSVEKFVKYLQDIRIIPKGSRILFDENAIPIGNAQGLALYLNGTELPEEVYKSNDINNLIAELQDALGEKCFMFSWWQGATETALYFYGDSFTEMNESIKHILNSNPLCNLSRIEQIA